MWVFLLYQPFTVLQLDPLEPRNLHFVGRIAASPPSVGVRLSGDMSAGETPPVCQSSLTSGRPSGHFPIHRCVFDFLQLRRLCLFVELWHELPNFPNPNKWGYSMVSLNNDVYVTGESHLSSTSPASFIQPTYHRNTNPGRTEEKQTNKQTNKQTLLVK